MFKTLKKLFEHSSINVTHIEEPTVKHEDDKVRIYCSYFMRITELRDELRSNRNKIEENELVTTTLNGLPSS